MTQHKWHKEIKAWADGAEIEHKHTYQDEWKPVSSPNWAQSLEFRIKPQVKITGRLVSNLWLEEHEARITALENKSKPQPHPKEPQYLYVYADSYYDPLEEKNAMAGTRVMNKPIKEWVCNYIGKIKLELEND